MNFPLPKNEITSQGMPKRSLYREKKVFIGTYPYKLQGGELHGFAMAEMACREAGEAYFGDGGFRALLTSHNRPLDKILPRHFSQLPLVNLRVSLLTCCYVTKIVFFF